MSETNLPKTGDAFIDQYAQAAVESLHQTGVPASVTLAQALIESNRGKSGLTREAWNFFGMKGSGTAGSVIKRTREVTPGGHEYFINAPFRKYHNAQESFADHARLFATNKRYAKAMAVKADAHQFAIQIQAAGYATAPDYAKTLIRVIDQYNLTRFDTL